MIDAGIPKKHQRILHALSSSGLDPNHVALLILTHTHYDHCGCLKELKVATGAKILVHEAEAVNLKRGYSSLPKGTLWYSKILSGLGNRLLPKRIITFSPVEPDIAIEDQFSLEEYGIDGSVIHTPGHSLGSLSIVIEQKHALVGDAAFHIFKNSAFPPFADDIQALLFSWKKLLDTDCEFFYPGHGTPFFRSVLEKKYVKYYEKFHKR